MYLINILFLITIYTIPNSLYIYKRGMGPVSIIHSNVYDDEDLYKLQMDSAGFLFFNRVTNYAITLTTTTCNV